MNKEDLKGLCEVQKKYAEMYYKSHVLCGITENYIQMVAEDFIEMFDDYEVKELSSQKSYEELSTTYCGVKIIALRYKKEEEI